MSTSILRYASIDLLVRSGQAPTVPNLARDWNMSERQLYRDIDLFRYKYGAPLEYDPLAGGFVYTEAYDLPRLMILEAGRQAAVLWHKDPQLAECYAFSLAWKQNRLAKWYAHVTFDLRKPPSRRGKAPTWYSTLAFQQLPENHHSFLFDRLENVVKEMTDPVMDNTHLKSL